MHCLYIKRYFRVCPNGDPTERKGQVDFYLMLAHLPSKSKSISIKYKLSFAENDVHYSTTSIYTKSDQGYGFPSNTLMTKDILKCNQFTFSVSAQLVVVEDKEGDDITDQYSKHEEKQSYDMVQVKEISRKNEWKITDPTIIAKMKKAANCAKFDSPIFTMHGFEWYAFCMYFVYKYIYFVYYFITYKGIFEYIQTDGMRTEKDKLVLCFI